MYPIEVVADDLTGAMDTSHGFAARGHTTTVVVDPAAGLDPMCGPAVLGVNTDSRYLDPAAARAAVVDAVAGVEAQLVYSKIDSTLRGNVATTVDAALEASGADVALVAPAFPAAGRTTEGGVHYVDGVPVADTEYAADEKGPVDSSIPALFTSIERPTVTLSLATIEAGPAGVKAALDDAVGRAVQPPIVVCDATESEHVATAAVGAAAASSEPLYVGSAELARHVNVDSGADAPVSFRPPTTDSAMGVVGSVSETTLTQLGRVPDEAIIRIDGTTLVEGTEPVDAVMRARSRLDEGRPVVLTAATSDRDVERALSAGSQMGLAPAAVRTRVRRGLAAATSEVFACVSPSGLFLSGGDVAVAVARSLDVTTVALTGEAVAAGVPVGVIADGDPAGLPVVTKAGGFGSPDAIEACLDALAP